MTAFDIYQKYKANKKRCGRKCISFSEEDTEYIEAKLQEGWSPDVIVGLGERRLPCSVSTLYRRFKQGIFDISLLPLKGKRKPNRYKKKRGKQAFTGDLRSREKEHPNYNYEFGHLEGDTIIGAAHKNAVITLVESLTKSIIVLKPKARTASAVENAISNWLESIPPNFFRSITFDCGKEFSNRKSISNRHDIDIYFLDPGTPSQGGLNEHSNGLLRPDGLPKQMDFDMVSEDYISSVARRRNSIPRKSLNYKTPIECMMEQIN